MKKKGKGKKTSVKDSIARVATPVREISVQTEESSPQLLYLASRLSTDDIGLYQSILSKDPKLPEVLLAEDQDPKLNDVLLADEHPKLPEALLSEDKDPKLPDVLLAEDKDPNVHEVLHAENKIGKDEAGLNTADYTSSLSSDNMGLTDTSARRVFSHIPLRKTAPRGRALVIHGADRTPVKLPENCVQKSLTGNAEVASSSDFTKIDPLSNKKDDVAAFNRRMLEIYENNACSLKRATQSKDKHQQGPSRGNHDIVTAYKKILTGRKSLTAAISPYNKLEDENSAAEVQTDRDGGQHDNTPSHGRDKSSSSGSKTKDVDPVGSSSGLLGSDHKESCRSNLAIDCHKPSINTRIPCAVKSLSNVPGKGCEESLNMSQQNHVTSSDETKSDKIKDKDKNQVDRTIAVETIKQSMDEEGHLSQEDVLPMCLQDGVASYKIWQQQKFNRCKTLKAVRDGKHKAPLKGKPLKKKVSRPQNKSNGENSADLKVQEPMITSETNFNKSSSAVLPPLLRTKLMEETDKQTSLKELKVHAQSRQNENNMNHSGCPHDDMEQSVENRDGGMTKGNQSDRINETCHEESEERRISTVSFPLFVKIRPTRKCAPTVFYPQDKRKSPKPPVEKKLHQDHIYSKPSKEKLTSIKEVVTVSKQPSPDKINLPLSATEAKRKITMVAPVSVTRRVIGDKKRKRSESKVERCGPKPKRRRVAPSDDVDMSTVSPETNDHFAHNNTGNQKDGTHEQTSVLKSVDKIHKNNVNNKPNKLLNMDEDTPDDTGNESDEGSVSESESNADSLEDAMFDDMSADDNRDDSTDEDGNEVGRSAKENSLNVGMVEDKENDSLEEMCQETDETTNNEQSLEKHSGNTDADSCRGEEVGKDQAAMDQTEKVTDFIAGRIKEKASRKCILGEKDKRGSAGWEESLRQRPKKTELFQVSLAPERSKVKETEKVKSTNELKDRKVRPGPGRPCKEDGACVIDPTLEVKMDNKSSKDPNLGEVVWGKLGRQRWWPGIVVEGYMVLKKQADPGKSWLLWFGDHKISELSREKTVPFVSNYKNFFGGRSNGVLFQQAVGEAVQVCGKRCGCDYNTVQLDAWAKSGFIDDKTSSPFDKVMFSPLKDKPLPDFVLEFISELRNDVRKSMDSDDDDEEEGYLKKSDQGDALDKVKEKEKELEEICISCNDSEQEVVFQHPLMHGGLCKECKQELTESFFAVGEDGTGMFCVICSNGGKMFVCENSDCNNVFCYECVKLFLDEERLEKIKEADPWICFLCCPYSEETHGHIIPKSDWKHNILKLYDSGYRVQDHNFDYLLNQDKKKIRVLSLFDGIGTGKVVLDLLGLDVEVYFTSEIDQESLLVTSFHYGDAVTPLGDVTKITTEKLREISPIDLLIGGSPCNDLSMANPARKGFNDFSSTAMLFFDFVRVLKGLQNFSDGHHVFWLYENVASMKRECQDIISRFLECEPALWDAKYFSAQTRPRYFWGNIPGMYSTPDLTDIKSTLDLDDVLSQNCNRKATVKVLRTVTTRQNSLKQGKNDAIFPVMMNGQDDMIWVSELERVFGFPEHYTDVGNIPVTKRRQMVGKAWSVPVVKNILHILTDFFAVKDTNDHTK